MPKATNLSPGAVKMLQERQFAHITTLMPDGSPQTTVVWVDVADDGSYVLVNTGDDRIKTRNLRRDPRVAVSILDPQNSQRLVTLRGEVVEMTKDGAGDHYRKLGMKYSGREPSRNSLDSRLLLRIKPSHVFERGIE